MAMQSLLGLPSRPSFGIPSGLDAFSKLSNREEDDQWHQTQIPISRFNTVSNGKVVMDMETGKGISLDFDKGTTTLAFKYQGGVCVCADSRATGGQYIGSNEVKKIIEINDYLLGTMAGGAADCVYWERVLAERCRIYELRNRERISVAAASKVLANIMYNYKGYVVVCV